MSKHIVIVESPAKAKTIGKFLGDDYLITASYGHVRDLPSKKLGVDVENNFEPDYAILKDKSKIIKDLKKLCQKKENIFLATDPDREGEAIAWHLEQARVSPRNVRPKTSTRSSSSLATVSRTRLMSSLSSFQ